MNRGFTLIEVVICLAIFIVITSLIMTRFGDYSRQAQVRDTAYDLALVMRQAQSYGLSVRNASETGTLVFDLPYGLAFSVASSPCGTATVKSDVGFALFADSDPVGSPNGTCGASDAGIRSYRYTNVTQSGLCAGTGPGAACAARSNVYVTYKRPNPEAVICYDQGGVSCGHNYAEIQLVGADGSTSKVIVRRTGQISVSI